MMNRREVLKICGGAVGAVAIANQLGWGLFEGTILAAEGRVKLTDAAGAPLKASLLAKDEALIFHYPHAGTPAYLVNLGTKVPGKKLASGQWAGGVGPKGSIVAFLAICPHQLSFARWDFNMVSYYAQDQAVYCCAHSSTFELKEGANPKEGSASTEPLAAVLLEHDAKTDELYAVGVLGGEVIDAFFKRHKQDLRGKYGSTKDAQALGETAAAIPQAEYSKVVACRKS